LPVYDYACTECGRTVEVIHGVHGQGPAACEVCGSAMRKLLSPPAIVFKGSGWAKKDARAASHARATKKHVQGSSDSGSGSGADQAGSGGAGTHETGGKAGGQGATGTSGGSGVD
jgi:putative FmdB family regulatory protein